MARAINKADVVGPSGGSREKTRTQENKESIAEHRPLLGPGTHRATNAVIRLGNVCVKLAGGSGCSKAAPARETRRASIPGRSGRHGKRRNGRGTSGEDEDSS